MAAAPAAGSAAASRSALPHVAPCEILLLAEVVAGGVELCGRAVRVVGKVKEHSHETQSMVLTLDGANLVVDVAVASPDKGSRTGSLFECSGTIDAAPDHSGGIVLRALLCRCVDGLDVALMKRALQVRRQFLADPPGAFVPPTNGEQPASAAVE
eukprot:m.101209 g.101209  ORF g.101209 m.101209 type:complete len:155 (+) comp15448_c0_seq1:2214-2678(+)